MKTATVTTFEVSDVVRATNPLPEVPYKQAVEALLTMGSPDRNDGWDDDEDDEDFIDDHPEPAPPHPLEACARYHGHLVPGVPFHPFIATVHRAFMDHRPLRLSPDAIWLLICQGVANHINASAEELRSRFVGHEGKVEIVVRRDDFVKGSPENPWAEVIDDLCDRVRQHVGPSLDLFLPAFTTTSPVERAVAGVVLLDAMRSYFSYEMDTLCGIPAIMLEGTAEDWQAVADRAEQFGSLDLGWWLEPLRGILRQFVAAARGEVDRPFWQSLYRHHDESGGPVITGWVSALFPYLKDRRTGLATNRNPWLSPESQRVRSDESDDSDIDDEIEDIDIDEDEDLDDMDCESDGVEGLGQEEGVEEPPAKKRLNRLILDRQRPKDTTLQDDPVRDDDLDENLDDDPDPEDDFDEDLEDDSERMMWAWMNPIPRRGRDEDLGGGDAVFYGEWPRLADLPSGLSKAAFRWNYRDQSFDMEFLGGFVGVGQDKETLAVRPEIGWAVREAGETA